MAEENINSSNSSSIKKQSIKQFDLQRYKHLLKSLLNEEVGTEELQDDDIPNLRKALRLANYQLDDRRFIRQIFNRQEQARKSIKDIKEFKEKNEKLLESIKELKELILQKGKENQEDKKIKNDQKDIMSLNRNLKISESPVQIEQLNQRIQNSQFFNQRNGSKIDHIQQHYKMKIPTKISKFIHNFQKFFRFSQPTSVLQAVQQEHKHLWDQHGQQAQYATSYNLSGAAPKIAQQDAVDVAQTVTLQHQNDFKEQSKKSNVSATALNAKNVPFENVKNAKNVNAQHFKNPKTASKIDSGQRILERVKKINADNSSRKFNMSSSQIQDNAPNSKYQCLSKDEQIQEVITANNYKQGHQSDKDEKKKMN